LREREKERISGDIVGDVKSNRDRPMVDRSKARRSHSTATFCFAYVIKADQ